jgi:hypothetical protein
LLAGYPIPVWAYENIVILPEIKILGKAGIEFNLNDLVTTITT